MMPKYFFHLAGDSRLMTCLATSVRTTWKPGIMVFHRAQDRYGKAWHGPRRQFHLGKGCA